MKAELESAGYEFAGASDGYREFIHCTTPTGWEYTSRGFPIHKGMIQHSWLEIITRAYAHLQERRELLALRRAMSGMVVNHIWIDSGEYEMCLFCGKYQDEGIEAHTDDCAWVALQEFNITAPDVETEHEMIHMLRDDDEQQVIRDLREGNNTRILRYADEDNSE